ncbi:MAG: hypothetical protein EOP19_27500 [Hyphomicrobiales bacterium]|nr:MAG: hypothetical protein EOP19_27500 [Hyphomicrobiales bacterium]
MAEPNGARVLFGSGGDIPVARDALVVGAGLALTVAPGAELALAYAAQLAPNATDHTLNARLAVRF